MPKKITFSIRVSEEEAKIWKEIAKYLDMPISGWIRAACNNVAAKELLIMEKDSKIDINSVTVKEGYDTMVVKTDGVQLFFIKYKISSMLNTSKYIVYSPAQKIIIEGKFNFGSWEKTERRRITEKIINNLLNNPKIEYSE
ncbi:MAG: hypothetical protein PF689_03075 [Deltaproteobacteria bacterium]|jgi:hypothetical protein|nr:hypothetical protein [Deltaproteobacteria bacterium]